MPGEVDRTRRTPPTHFDGRFHWYTKWVDFADDRCSLCRGPIGEDEIPLILWRDVQVVPNGKSQTWEARFCETCTPIVATRLRIGAPR